MKHLSAILLVLVLAISFSACGSSGNTGQESAPPTEAADRQVIYLVPDTDAISGVSAEQLNTVKAFAESRAGDVTAVTVDEENKRIVVETAREIPDSFAQELTAIPRLTFRDPDGGVVMDGGDVASAAAIADGSDHLVEIQFTESGKEKFASVTEAYINQIVSVYLDDKLIAGPMIYAVITDGTAQIFNNYSREEAAGIAAEINAAVLPFPIKAVRE